MKVYMNGELNLWNNLTYPSLCTKQIEETITNGPSAVADIKSLFQ